MKKILFALMVFLPSVAAAETLLLGEYKNGSKLHKQSCISCHNSSIYTRKDRKVRTISGLEQRVEMCSTRLKTNYSDDQNNDIVKFLNDDYYKFK